jgi:hypothetical protein
MLSELRQARTCDEQRSSELTAIVNYVADNGGGFPSRMTDPVLARASNAPPP